MSEEERADASDRSRVEAVQNEEEAARRKLRSLTEMRAFHEKQVSLIERLPAGEVAWFLDSQRMRAAVLIQSWWRRRRRERWPGREEKDGMDRVTRRAAGQLLQRNGEPNFPVARFVEGADREVLQAEIDRYRRENPPPRLSEEQLRQTHSEVQQLLSEFYSRRQQTVESREDSLLQTLDEDCKLLMEGPKLRDLKVGKKLDPRFFAAGSQTLAMMAQKMHTKEMKAAGLPLL